MRILSYQTFGSCNFIVFQNILTGITIKENREEKTAVHGGGDGDVGDVVDEGVGDVGVGVPCVTRCQWT